MCTHSWCSLPQGSAVVCSLKTGDYLPQVSDTALALATSLGGPLPEQELAEGEEYLKSLNEWRVKTYKEGVEKLVDLFEAGNL